MKVLSRSFYLHENVAHTAKKLLGKVLITNIQGKRTSGIIVETEAYSYKERGCHAFKGKMTERNKIMFGKGGFAYVYLCYGVHQLFNVVTNKQNKPEAVLIRALQPLEGTEWMTQRMQTDSLTRITSGPGKLTKALGIDRTLNGKDLITSEVCIREGVKVNNKQIVTATRIGIDYAGPDAKLLWRFYIKDNNWISRT